MSTITELSHVNNTPDSERVALKQTAKMLVKAGISIIPVDSATKQPMARFLPDKLDSTGEKILNGNGKPKRTWKPYQNQLPAQADLDKWFPESKAIAIVCGQVSGGVEAIDFDDCDAYPNFHNTWRSTVQPLLAEYQIPHQRTGNGYHYFYKSNDVGSSQKLAWVPDESEKDGRRCVIETRGEGTYIIVAPSLHPNGTQYEIIEGDLSDIPVIPLEVAKILKQTAQELCEAPFGRKHVGQIEKITHERNERMRDKSANPSVIDEYNDAHSVSELLELNGYIRRGSRYVRPGGKSPSVYVENQNNRSYHHSSNDPLNSVYYQRPFDVYLYYRHGNDLKVAVKAAAVELGMEYTTSNGNAANTSSLAYSTMVLENLAEEGYSFRLNDLDDTIEVNGTRITSEQAAMIRVQMRDRGIRNMKAVEDVYTAEAAKKRYHPVKDFFNDSQWNGVDHIHHLCSYLDDKHEPIVYQDGTEKSVTEAWLTRWLIGAVGKIYEQGSLPAQNPMLVLDGGQGLGKSMLARFLGSPWPNLFHEGTIQPDSKEQDRLLSTKFIWEVAELGATTRRADREALKATITKHSLTFRIPFHQHPLNKPVLASFIGTINNEAGFLTDPTGNRRFLCVTLTDIDWRYQENVDVQGVWAQAYELYKNGEPWQLTAEESMRQSEINQGYEVEDPLEGRILTLFDVDLKKDSATDAKSGWFITTDEITKMLQDNGVTGATTQIHKLLATTLRGLGLKKDNNARPRGYRGIRVKGAF